LHLRELRGAPARGREGFRPPETRIPRRAFAGKNVPAAAARFRYPTPLRPCVAGNYLPLSGKALPLEA
jgi:hypothetical protein